MRSIRRSLLGYFMLLLALALGGVGLLVDRFAVAAIKDREEAEAKRIEKAYELRQHEAKVKFDAELLTETKSLARELQPKLAPLLGRGPGGPGGGPGAVRAATDLSLQAPEKDTAAGTPRGSVENYRLRLTMLELTPSPWPRTAAAIAMDPPALIRVPGRPEIYRLVSPLWTSYDGPRALARIQEAVRKLFDDDEQQGFYQFHLIVNFPGHSGRTVSVVRSPKLAHDLPLDLESLDRNSDAEYQFDDVMVPGKGMVRRVLKNGGRPSLNFWVQFPIPPSIASFRTLPRVDLALRVVVSHARPYSELEARLAEEQRNGDEELAQVRNETRKDLTQLRNNLVMIGTGSFVALVLGGWFLVARGLAPIRKLSEAVSRVSEKDFRLPVEREELSHELLPILAGLTHTLDSLRQAFAREKQSVGDISHELRTPIASILATIDVSLRKPRTTDQYRTTLEDCRGIARQLGQLVERIMLLATLDSGTARDCVARTDAVDVACSCATVIRPLAEAHGMIFSLEANGPLDLDTDPDKLREVLMNLLHNAVEYNREGGRVDFNVKRVSKAIVFEIADTGIGMPLEVREKIFERFYRADASRHATGIHAGLGLAIVKEYVERLGGTIAVESTPDAGSTFRVALPAAPSEESDDISPSAERARPNPRRRVEPTPTGS